jgi:hypothetical protein
MSALKDLHKKNVTDLSDLEMCILITDDPQRYDGYYVQPSVAAAELAALREAVETARDALQDAKQYANSRRVRSGIVNASAARVADKCAAALAKLDGAK